MNNVIKTLLTNVQKNTRSIQRIILFERRNILLLQFHNHSNKKELINNPLSSETTRPIRVKVHKTWMEGLAQYY